MSELSLTGIFAVIIISFLILDLGYFNRQAHKISLRSATIQSIFWIVISLLFALLINYSLSHDLAFQFLTAYVTEKMLSVDNLFVILLIFNYFKLEEKYYHKILFWGIMGAIIFRAIFIGVGAYIVSQFEWVLYIFGAILLYTGIRLFTDKKEEHVDLEKNRVLKASRKYLPITNNDHGGKFFVKEAGKWFVTPLFLIVLLVESTDIIFAIDSIPAAFAISQDNFVIFTSNIFAIMGLRAMFFLLEGVIHKFHHLQKGLAFVLVFIGAKMLAGIFHIHIDSLLSFSIIMGALGLSIALSFMYPKKI